MNQFELTKAAAVPKYLNALSEIDRALVLLIGARSYISSAELARLMHGGTPRDKAGVRHYGATWDTLKGICENSPYISNAGGAGSGGTYWTLTAEGVTFKATLFDYMLIKEATS